MKLPMACCPIWSILEPSCTYQSQTINYIIDCRSRIALALLSATDATSDDRQSRFRTDM